MTKNERGPKELGLKPETTFDWSLGLRTLQIDDEMVVLDLLRDKNYRLNRTAAMVWALVGNKRSLEDISNQLVEDFSLDKEEAYREASGFLAELISRGLVATTSEGSLTTKASNDEGGRHD